MLLGSLSEVVTMKDGRIKLNVDLEFTLYVYLYFRLYIKFYMYIRHGFFFSSGRRIWMFKLLSAVRLFFL
jgi:hypothetical protein